jgi:RNA polymerase sigma-70 factor, ECF subfamily
MSRETLASSIFHGAGRITKAFCLPVRNRCACNMRPTTVSPALESLLSAARNGDSAALGQLFRCYEKILLRMARRVLPADLAAKGGASDLLQDTYFEAQRDFPKFRGAATNGDLLAWLRRLLRNNFLNFVRTYRRREKRAIRREQPLGSESWMACRSVRDRSAPAPGPGTDAIENESREHCRQAIAKLPDSLKQLIRWRFDERLSFPEIGARLQMSADGARKLLSRTLRKLSCELNT